MALKVYRQKTRIIVPLSYVLRRNVSCRKRVKSFKETGIFDTTDAFSIIDNVFPAPNIPETNNIPIWELYFYSTVFLFITM